MTIGIAIIAAALLLAGWTSPDMIRRLVRVTPSAP